MTQSIGIAGAGIIGRLIALKAAAQGKKVTLFDRDETPACSVVAPAMLAPYCELDVAEKAVSDLGVESLKLWPEILKSLDAPVFFQQEGSLVVAHPASLRSWNLSWIPVSRRGFSFRMKRRSTAAL